MNKLTIYQLLSFEIFLLIFSQGIPPRIMEAAAKQGLTEEMIMQNPMTLKEILYSMDLTEVLQDGM